MEEMYRAALDLLRIVEHYDTEGTDAEKAVASKIISEYRLPWMVHPFLTGMLGGRP
jgi:fido (protein-threonine AMPylation protein)